MSEPVAVAGKEEKHMTHHTQQHSLLLRAPAVPVLEGLAAKAPLSLPAYVAATTKLEGRDKLTKVQEDVCWLN
jgi:hypothetical protein